MSRTLRSIEDALAHVDSLIEHLCERAEWYRHEAEMTAVADVLAQAGKIAVIAKGDILAAREAEKKDSECHKADEDHVAVLEEALRREAEKYLEEPIPGDVAWEVKSVVAEAKSAIERMGRSVGPDMVDSVTLRRALKIACGWIRCECCPLLDRDCGSKCQVEIMAHAVLMAGSGM